MTSEQGEAYYFVCPRDGAVQTVSKAQAGGSGTISCPRGDYTQDGVVYPMIRTQVEDAAAYLARCQRYHELSVQFAERVTWTPNPDGSTLLRANTDPKRGLVRISGERL